MKSKKYFVIILCSFFLISCKPERHVASFVLLNRITSNENSGVVDYKFNKLLKKKSKESRSYLEVFEVYKDSSNKQLLIAFDVLKPSKNEYLLQKVDYVLLNKNEVEGLKKHLESIKSDFFKLKVKKRFFSYKIKDDFKITVLAYFNVHSSYEIDVKLQQFTLWKGDKCFVIDMDYFVSKVLKNY